MSKSNPKWLYEHPDIACMQKISSNDLYGKLFDFNLTKIYSFNDLIISNNLTMWPKSN
jgi:hypothetical protein